MVFALASALAVAPLGIAQGSGGQSSTGSPALQGSTGSGANATIPAAQKQLSNASGEDGAQASTSSFQGSLVEGKATDTVLDLSLDEAIGRGLRTNLGVILQGSALRNAGGQRLEQLQPLLPTVSAQASYTVEQVNLAAEGIKFPGLNPIIGPFQVIDFRAYLTQNLVNLQALQSYIAARHSFDAARLTAEDARDLVVLTVGNAYLLCIADQARVEAVQAELATSKLSLDQASAAHAAGTSPRIDELRARVDYQNEQQTLISTTNDLAKAKLALARTIGLPLDQKFRLTDSEPYQSLDTIDPEAAFNQALKQRKDLAAAAAQVRSGEALERAARDERLPTAFASGDFGDIGTTPGHSHGTYTATGTVSVPILQIAKDRGDAQIASATLESARARYSDQMQQVNADIRNSILDIRAAAKLVEAAQSNVELAREALSEAQQRFRAGVADNLPVSQAQTTTEQANDQYIAALYQHNVAKLSLARALGIAEAHYKDYLGGK
jgi:outer membrane protein TolC